MAEGERPTSELLPPGGAAVPPDSALSTDPAPRISDPEPHISDPVLVSGYPPCSQRDGDGRADSQVPLPGTSPSPHLSAQPAAERGAPSTSARPRSVAEGYAWRERGGVTGGGLRARGGVASSERGEHPASLASFSSSHKDLRGDRLSPPPPPVQRSHSDTLHLVREGEGPPPHADARSPGCPGGDSSTQEAQVQARLTLACKQAMRLQLRNMVAATCGRGGGGGAGATSPSDPTARVCGDARHPPCCGATTLPEDTFASYCHRRPIPSPAQRPPPCPADLPAPPPPPRLVSSAGETGPDAVALPRCCCSSGCPAHPGGGGRQGGGGSSSSVSRSSVTTRDAGTMTSRRHLRDAEVQTEEVSPPHVFPRVRLVETDGNGAGHRDAAADEAGGGQKSPVKEVMWDAEGMTWDVYGASVDPADLGLAIQRHLEMQIKETASRAAKLPRQDAGGGAGRAGKRGGVMGGIAGPGCCACSSSAVD